MLELASILILGISAQWIAWYTKIPAILPLILTGLIAGPLSTVLFNLEHPLLEPIWNGERGLFPGDLIYHFTSLAVSIILFEGGLTLKRSEIRGLGTTIFRLISLGALITFLLGGYLTHLIFDLSWKVSFLIAALIIVTGPTVIGPILKNIKIKRHLATVLKWEGILIDPIGALIALLTYQFIIAEHSHAFTQHALKDFFIMTIIGSTIGFSSAHALAFGIKSKKIPSYLVNIFTLAFVLFVFVVSDILASESGLLAVVTMGMVMGNLDMPYIKQIINFKETLSILLISILFILLASNLTLHDLNLMYSSGAIIFLASVILLRIGSVIVCTYRSGFKIKEKLFIGWLGPRGIIAAGMSSLFSIKLIETSEPDAEYITPIVFMVVLGSVIINAITAKPISRFLKVSLNNTDDVLIVGASRLSIALAKYLLNKGRYATLVDNNLLNISSARKHGVPAAVANVFSGQGFDSLEIGRASYLICLTGNIYVDESAIDLLDKDYGEKGSYRLFNAKDTTDGITLNNVLFAHGISLPMLLNLYDASPTIKEVRLSKQLSFKDVQTYVNKDFIPLLILKQKGGIDVIVAGEQEHFAQQGDVLVYLGQLPKENPIQI